MSIFIGVIFLVICPRGGGGGGGGGLWFISDGKGKGRGVQTWLSC